jgi:hypothetical protein
MADDEGTSVTEASQTSGEANPMDEAPAEPTEAQQEQGASTDEPGADIPAVVDPDSLLPGADAAAEQHAKDEAWRIDHPNEVLVREANPQVGGESFDRYFGGDTPSGS